MISFKQVGVFLFTCLSYIDLRSRLRVAQLARAKEWIKAHITGNMENEILNTYFRKVLNFLLSWFGSLFWTHPIIFFT